MGPRIKKNVSKKMQKTKEKVVNVLNQARTQARESLKILELLEGDKLAKAGKRLTDETIQASLKKLGIAALSDIQELKSEIRRLETEIIKLKSAPVVNQAESPTLQSL